MIDYLIIDDCPGSGITGKIVRLIRFLSDKIKNIDDVSNIYIESKILPTMNIIFEPCNKEPDISLIFRQNITNKKKKSKNKNKQKNLLKNSDFDKLSKITKLIRFNMSIFKQYLKDVKKNKIFDLGIHIRLTDMNKVHKRNYGVINYEDYTKEILNVLKLNKFNNIFLASDNFESITLTTNLLKDNGFSNENIFYNNNKLLSDSQDNENFTEEQIQNFKNKNSFIEVLNDVFYLSISKKLIYRTSNVSNLAILLSTTLGKNNIKLIN